MFSIALVIVIGACLAASPYILTKIEQAHHIYLNEIKKTSPNTMFFIVEITDRRDQKIVDAYDTWTDAIYAMRITSRNLPHCNFTIEKV